MSGRRAWREYLAADEEYERADRRLRATAYEPALVGALISSGDGALVSGADAALEFLSVHRPLDVVNRCVDVLLPLALEGGSELGDVRELVLAADRAVVAKALPTVVARVVDGPDEGDAAYLAYHGLMDLLERLEERQWLRYVMRAARLSRDPEIHSAADDFDDDFGALDDHGGDRTLAPAQSRHFAPLDPNPALEAAPDTDPEAGRDTAPDAVSDRDAAPEAEVARAWEDYVWARARRNAARNDVLLRRGFGAGLRQHLRSAPHATARLAAELLGSEYTDDLREALGSLDPAALREAVSFIADALLADHGRRTERYRALLTLLTEIPDAAGFAAALERARACPDPDIQRLAP